MNRTTSDDGTAIAWTEAGAGAPLVLVHSLGAHSVMWESQARHLADRHRVLSVDMRGHGASGAPYGAYTVERLGQDILAVAAEAEVDTFHLGGISLGGQVALWIALRHPGQVRSVVLSNTAARIGSREGWEERVAAVRAGGMAGISERVVGGWFTSGFASRHPERWNRAKEMFEGTDPEGYIGCCRALGEADLREEVETLSVPALVITGDQDSSTPPAEAEWLHQRIQGSRLEVMENSAHLPNLENPDDYSALLSDWLT